MGGGGGLGFNGLAISEGTIFAASLNIYVLISGILSAGSLIHNANLTYEIYSKGYKLFEYIFDIYNLVTKQPC